MSKARIMDGKALAASIREELRQQIPGLESRHGRAPALGVVLVGDDAGSQVYVRNKERACERIGMGSRTVRMGADCTRAQLNDAVEALNGDENIDGFLVQLPLPSQLDPAEVRGWIDPRKDVDGLHPENVGLLASGTPRFVPCTPAGCLEMLRAYDVPTEGRRAVVVGRSLIVGRPMSHLLSGYGVDATVTLCHSKSDDLAGLCREADILVVAAGRPQMVESSWVRPGAVVIDVGIHRLDDPSAPRGSRLVGDVHPDVAQVAGLLSPVPGGVGPMTIAMLLRNTVQAFGRHLQ